MLRGGRPPTVLFIDHRLGETPAHVTSIAALDPGFSRFVVGREARPFAVEKTFSIWSADAGTIVPLTGDPVLDLVVAPSGKVVALAGPAKDGGEVGLFQATIDGTSLRLDRAIPLSPVRIPFGKSRDYAEDRRLKAQKDGDDPDEDDQGSPGALARFRRVKPGQLWVSGRVHLSANAYGIGVASTFRGVVAVLDPETLASTLAVRLPSPIEQHDLFVSAAPGGAIVTSVVDGRDSSVAFVSLEGKRVAEKTTVNKEVPYGWMHEAVLVTRDRAVVGTTSAGAVSVSLPKLSTKVASAGESLVGGATNRDGRKAFWAYGEPRSDKPEGWQFFLAEDGKEEELDLEGALSPPVARAKPIPSDTRRAAGSAVLGVSPQAAWTAVTGAETDLPLSVTNTGGATERLDVVLAGPALDAGLVALLTRQVSVLVPGAVKNEDPRRPDIPGGPVTIRVRIAGKKAGNALLTVRVTPSGQTSGSALCGRPIVVTG
jgi:hypothetical protein